MLAYLLGIFITIVVGFAFLLLWVTRELEPQYRKVTEEPLADAAYIFASLAAVTAKDGKIDTRLFEQIFCETDARPVSGRIYDFVKQDVDLHVYVTDRKRLRFLENISRESARIRALVDKLLLLSSLESRKTGIDSERLDMKEIVSDVIEGMAPVLDKKDIRLEIRLHFIATSHNT